LKAAVYHGRRDVRVEEVPEPATPDPGSVVLEISRASVCGTDLSEFMHGPVQVPLHERHRASGHVGPLILGHEMTGRVAAIGERVGELALGDRVVPGAGSWCGTCGRCREGRLNLCERYFVYGLHAPGGLAERARLSAKMCHRVPDRCPDDAAVLAQPLAIALHAIRRSGARRGDSLAVVGVGGIGSMLVAAARTLAPEPLIALDVDPARLGHAARLGADVTIDAARHDAAASARRLAGGEGLDVAIEASGTPYGLQLAAESVRNGGRVHLVGLPAAPSTLDLHACVVREIDVSSSNGHVCMTDIPQALELLAVGELAPRVTDRVVELERLVPDGLEPMARGETHGKVVVTVG
jgi:(R,R)-butanediol dehydrogenase/meso-butanediol dehydrogenase/diacetyl reductase